MLLNDKKACCENLNDGSNLDNFFSTSDEEVVQDLKAKHELIAKNYANKCADSLKNIATIVCSTDEKESDLNDLYSPDQLKKSMKERVEALVEKGSAVTPAEQAEIVGFGALTCGLESVGTKTHDQELGITDTFTNGGISPTETSSLMEVDLYLSNKKEIDNDKDGNFGSLVNFQTAKGNIFCEMAEIEQSGVGKSVLSSVLYAEPLTQEEVKDVQIDVVENNQSPGSDPGIFESKHYNDYMSSGGSSKGYANKYKSRRRAPMPFKPKNGALASTTSDVSGGVMETIDTSIGFPGGSTPVDSSSATTTTSASTQLEDAEFSQEYLKELKAVEEVEKLLVSEKDNTREPASDLDDEKRLREFDKREKEIERRRKELASQASALDREIQKEKLSAIERENASLGQELESLKEEKRQIIADKKQRKIKNTNSNKKVASQSTGNNPEERTSKTFGNTFSTNRRQNLAIPNNIKQNSGTTRSAFNNNPEFSFQVQEPLTRPNLLKLLSLSTDINVKYDGDGKPFLFQVIGKDKILSDYLDIRQLSEEDREAVYKKLNFDQADITGARVKEEVDLIKKTISKDIEIKKNTDNSIDVDSMRLIGLRAVMDAAVKNNNKQLLSVLISEIE
jgi:hypothetical protein